MGETGRQTRKGARRAALSVATATLFALLLADRTPPSAMTALSWVESRKGAVAWAVTASLRFPSPLIKPDVRISRIRLSDWLHLEAHGGVPR